MRNKTMWIGGLAIVLGVSTASAQPPRGDRPARPSATDSTFRGRRGPGRGPEPFLLRGITLSDAQKQQLATLREKQRDAVSRDQGRKAFDEVRALRQRGDTATARAKMAQLRTQMEQRREQQFAAIRTMLTTDQRKQFDANVAEMKQRQAQRGERDGGRNFGGRRGEASGRAGA